MSEFSFADVIRHSQRIEQESYTFYTAAEPRISEPDMKGLVKELAAAEVEHFNRLRGLLDESRLTPEELAVKIYFEEPSLDVLVPVRPLPDSGTAREIKWEISATITTVIGIIDWHKVVEARE